MFCINNLHTRVLVWQDIGPMAAVFDNFTFTMWYKVLVQGLNNSFTAVHILTAGFKNYFTKLS